MIQLTKKSSVTGLMTQQHETHRLENLFYKRVKSAYYLQDYGLDWDYWTNRKVELPVASFISYLSQRATLQSIVVLDMSYQLQDFTLDVTAKLLDEEIVLTGGV